MQILIITKHLEPGGITSYVVSLVKGLKDRGHNCIIASSGGSLKDTLINSNIEHIELNLLTKSEVSPKIIWAIKRLLKIIKQKDIQIIHAQTRVTSVVAYWLSKFSGVPYLTTCHGFFKPRFFRKLFPCWGKKVIAISQAVKNHLTEDFRLQDGCVELIYNGIDISRFLQRSIDEATVFKNNLGLSNGPIIGIIARLSIVKGHKYLIMAMKDVLKKIPQAQLLIIGEGKIKSELIDLARSLNLEKNVFFSPNILDTNIALSIMDVFVMPSLQEGLGLSIMEAMATGLPVIATNVGGITDLVKDNETGILLSKAEPEALAKAMSFLLLNKTEALRIGKNGQRLIQEKFSLDEMLDKTEKLYKFIIYG